MKQRKYTRQQVMDLIREEIKCLGEVPLNKHYYVLGVVANALDRGEKKKNNAR